MSSKPEDLAETRLSSTQVFQGRLLNVWSDEVRLPGGETSVREHIKHPGAVLMIPVLGDDRILLIEQFRYATGEVEIELPAGTLDPGETKLDAVKRELLEETGYTAGSIAPVAEIHPCIGYSSERIWVYLVKDLTEGDWVRPADEFIRVNPQNLETCLAWVRKGKIKDVKAIIGLFWAEKIFTGQWPHP